MTMKIFTTTAVAAVLSASVASAGGLSEPVVVAPVAPAPAAPVMASNDWTGFYAGGQIGTGQFEISPAGAGDDDVDADSLTNYGVHAGYLMDLGSFVVGGEVDYDILDVEDAEDDAENNVLRGKAIVGYDAGALLPYAVVGLASAGVDGLDDRETGLVYGIGAAYQVSDNFRIGGEALAHDFRDIADTDDFDADVSTFSLKASFTF